MDYLTSPKMDYYPDIPMGNTREDIKARRHIIKDFYAHWIVAHPDKKVWNISLKAYIHIKFQSINETAGHAAISYKSTCAVMHLSAILQNSVIVERWPPKFNDRNQKPYSVLFLLRWKTYRLIVGLQKSTSEYVQYYVGSQ